jgi:SNF2 family DNA or RNA helicase
MSKINFDIGFGHLTEYQKDIFRECIQKKNGGISVPMGSGKTLVSLVVGLSQKTTQEFQNPILVVMSKTLLSSWKYEINKFFGSSLKVLVLHQEAIKNIEIADIDFNVDVVLTTADVVGRYYTKANIEYQFVDKLIINPNRWNQHIINRYNIPDTPYHNVITGPFCLFSVKWSVLIVDEVQKYTNINTATCKGLGSICAEHRWVMSGTIFDEPKIERILGYYIIINHPTFPRNLPKATEKIRHRSFEGFDTTLVKRTENITYTLPEVNEVIINHTLTSEEQYIYLCMKETMRKINTALKEFRTIHDTDNVRKFGSYLLATLGYLRQSVICPLIPLAKATLDTLDFKNKSILATTILEELYKNDNGIAEWLNNPNSIKSSRISQALDVIDSHPQERIVIFTSFRTCLDLIKHFLPKNRVVSTLSSTMNINTRNKVIQDFSNSNSGILLLTYDIGNAGLNLQASNTILLLDFWWNHGTTQQAIARVLRFGQIASKVNIYYFVSNTGVEQAVFKKQYQKIESLKELASGPMTTEIKPIKLQEIIKFIDLEDSHLSANNVFGVIAR